MMAACRTVDFIFLSNTPPFNEDWHPCHRPLDDRGQPWVSNARSQRDIGPGAPTHPHWAAPGLGIIYQEEFQRYDAIE